MSAAAVSGPTIAALRRAAREGGRDPGPSWLLPALPSVLMAVAFTALFSNLSEVIAFPSGSFEEFLVPGIMVFVGLAGGGFTSSQLAADLRSGFMDRLRLHLHGPLPLLLGRFAFEAVRILPGTIVVLLLGLAVGGAAPNGIGGIAVAVALTAILATAYSGLFYVVATLTRDPQTPLNLQPIGILLFFFSSAVVPPSAMPGWAEAIANVSPITQITDGARAAMIGDLASGDVLLGFGVAVALLAASVIASTSVLGRAIARS